MTGPKPDCSWDLPEGGQYEEILPLLRLHIKKRKSLKNSARLTPQKDSLGCEKRYSLFSMRGLPGKG